MSILSEKDEKISCPMGSDPESLHGLPPRPNLLESPPLSMDFTDVNVVPEDEKSALEQTIANLEDEILGLKLKQKSLVEKERRTLNKILDIKGAIRVFCRIRPFLSSDGIQIRQPVSSESEKIMVKCGGSRKDFVFDKVFSYQATTQEDVFVEVEPILKSALDGNNVCILAFGQTGTGKTFTMEGTNQQLGIVSRALKALFHEASLDSTSSYTFSMSMLEVYMGNLRDLLVSKSSYKPYEAVMRSNLNIQTDQKGHVEIEGLTEMQIPDLAKANWWYAKGRRVRSTSWTNVNETSSRSHCLTRINIYRRGDMKDNKTEVTKLWMIDLGGSERVLKTGATGQTLDEGRAINLSISALGDVIAALRRKRGHVPYRNSKLTQILKDSLGDGSKVLMLVHVSPCEDDVAETTCSLSFAKRASAVESNKELPADLKKVRENRIAALEEEIHVANEECQKVRNQIQNAELLLSENKKLFSSTYDHHSPKGDDAIEGSTTPPLKPEKTLRRKSVSNSQPRFMTSTAASRHRQNAAEKVVIGRARTMPFGSTNSIHLSSSQTASYSDPRFKGLLRNTNKKSRYSEEITRQSTPDGKIVSLSNPNLRVTLNRHRRRMSDFT